MTSSHIDDLRIDGIRSSGVWGAVIGAVAVGTIQFFLLYSYYYLDLSNEPFVPERIPTPPVLLPSLLIGGLLLTVLPAASVFRAAVEREPGRITAGSAILAGAGAVFLVSGAWLVRGLELTPRADAYSASVVLVLGFHALVTVTGVTMAAYVTYQSLRMLAHPWLLSASSVLVVWWCYVLLGWLAVGFSLFVYPQLSTGTT